LLVFADVDYTWLYYAYPIGMFACAMPGTVDLKLIYNQIFQGHLLGWPAAICELGEKIVEAAITLFQAVAARFLPSAVKFTYNWNMRELTNIFQGMTLSRGAYYERPADIVKLWCHECARVFQDKPSRLTPSMPTTRVSNSAACNRSFFGADFSKSSVLWPWPSDTLATLTAHQVTSTSTPSVGPPEIRRSA